MNIKMFEAIKKEFDELIGKNRFTRLDSAVLKTMMMLAAVDGSVSEDEITSFKALAEKCRGYNGESFDALWDSAVHSAGYLLLQSRFLDPDDLVKAFVKEAEAGFVSEVRMGEKAEREDAFLCLEKMASADGDYSPVERACIAALVQRVKEARDQMIAERYPRARLF